MPKLVKYGMMSTEKNGLGGYLVKAQCYICGAKYGSIEEAKKCEEKCLRKLIGMELTNEIYKRKWQCFRQNKIRI